MKEICDRDGIRFYRYSYSDKDRMISEDRRYIEYHPRNTVKSRWNSDADYIICPYCGHKHDLDHSYDPYEARDEEIECESCYKTFVLNAEFGHGFVTTPKKCKHHEFVFVSQYYYEGKTWRNFNCLHCNESWINTVPYRKYCKKEKKFIKKGTARTLLPWLYDYNDPDYFDPKGILKPTEEVDLTEHYETPILDFLDDLDWWTKQPKWKTLENKLGKHLKKYENHD